MERLWVSYIDLPRFYNRNAVQGIDALSGPPGDAQITIGQDHSAGLPPTGHIISGRRALAPGSEYQICE